MSDQPSPSGEAQATEMWPTTEEPPVAGAPGGQPLPPIGGLTGLEQWRRRRLALFAAAVLGVLLLLYGLAYAAVGGEIARGTTVLGVPIGGLSHDDAEDRLAAELPPVVDQPQPVTVGEDSFEVVPSEAGLSVDYAATVADAPGGRADPVSLVRALFGGGEVEPVPAVDQPTLDRAVAGIADLADTEPIDGTVGFADGEAVSTAAVTGVTVDRAGAAEVVADAFPGSGEPVALPAEEVPPTVTQAEVDRALAEFAQPAMSAPVDVAAGNRRTELPPAVIGAALTMTPDAEGRLEPQLDADKLVTAAEAQLSEIGQDAKDATVVIDGGRPVVVPAQEGQGVDPERLATEVLAVLTATGADRVATVEVTTIEPELTTAAAQELGVVQVISEFTTRYPHAAYRNTNIGRAAGLIDNTLLEPGEVFSLNGIVGERTRANGFTEGYVINSGRLVEELGGGVSQLATTTYNAAFFGGMEDVEHKPHSLYFSRYPMGREATVAWPSLDLAFKNNTPYGVLVDTSVRTSSPGNQGALTVRLWSTPYWKVDSTTSDPTNYTNPATVYDTSSDCEQQAGIRGFDVTVTRTLSRPGAAAVTEEYFTRYKAGDQVICGAEPAS